MHPFHPKLQLSCFLGLSSFLVLLQSKHIKYFDTIFAPVTDLRNHLTTQKGSGSHPNRSENKKSLLHNEVPLFLELLSLSERRPLR